MSSFLSIRSWALSVCMFCSVPAVLAEPEWTEDLSLSAILSFESEYVFRGQKQGGESFQPSVEAGYPVGPGDLYAGIWASQDISGDPSDEVDFYGGYRLPLTPIFALSAGLTYYWYPDDGSVPSREEEPFVGISADLPLSPSLFAYYNFALEQMLVELSVGDYVRLAGNTFLEGGLVLGLGRAGDSNSDEVPGKSREDFGYYLSYLNLVYDLNEISSVSLGVRYSGRWDDSFSDFLYWGASVSFGF